MGKIQIKIPEDFLLKLSKLENRTDTVIPRVLEAGGETVLSKVKSNLRSVIGRNTKFQSRSTGALVAALGLSSAKQDRKGDFNVKIGFAEPRKGNLSNAKIANILEYGKSGQPPKPFLKPAKTATQRACIEAMKSKLESELKNV